jgi:pyruvate kinase
MKILPTIGPISEKNSDIEKILKITDIVRINGSHNILNWHIKISKKIKKIDINARILLDIPGVKPRTQNKKDINIKKNQNINLIFDNKLKSKNNYLCIKCSNKLPKISKKPNFFSLDDGKYLFKIIEIKNSYIVAKSLENFILKPMKGINIPLGVYDDNFQNKQYNKFLYKSKNIKFDAIGLSYVQSGKIIQKIKKKFPEKLIISKIENLEGLKNYKEIIKHSDGIMIDRGDLSAEIGDENLYLSIVKISDETKKNGKPLIIATENLISMNTRLKPTKSEIMSLGLAQQLDVDIIMLSDETAILKNWNTILKWLENYLKKTILSVKKKIAYQHKTNIFWNLVDKLPDIPFVIFSKKGFALNNITKFRQNTKLIIFSDNDKTIALGAFRKNTICYKVDKFDKKNFSNFIKKTIKKYRSVIFKESKIASLIYIVYPEKNSRANTISILSKKEFF